MESYIKTKIEDFITILLESKLDMVMFDIYMTERYKTKKHWYTFKIDTKVPVKPNSIYGLSFSFSTQMVTFSVCVDDGSIILEKDDYLTFKDTDIEFAKKCAILIEEKHKIKQVTILDSIVDTTNTELKLNRESNISKLKI
jgi:hypothetical protein